MAQDTPTPHSPSEAPKRPKGILKNPSYQQTSPEARVSPTSERTPLPTNNDVAVSTPERPSTLNREFSEKEIVQMNTEINAGNAHRRNSSNPRSSISRRQSSNSNVDASHDEHGQRLKWDEANLYLNEGQMGGRMKIDEPKTPYAKQYDPADDDEAISTINADELAVDELEMEKGRHASSTRSRDVDIPGLDLGEPEMDPRARRESDGERKVIVESDDMDIDRHHGEEREEDMSVDELQKHKKFEQLRKKHYEMKNIKNLLGHPEDLDVDEEEEGANGLS